MRFTTTIAAALPVVAVSATNFQVMVGNNQGLAYDPPQVTGAAVGDTVSFVFMSKNHTVTQSTFPAPCQPMPNGIDSGFQNVPADATSLPSWSFTVNDTSAPLWFFCKQTGHCEKGMVFALNPTDDKTFANFQSMANASSADGTPPSSAAAASGSAPASSGAAAASGSASGSSPSASATAAGGDVNGAVSMSVRAGGLLAALGLAAGLLL